METPAESPKLLPDDVASKTVGGRRRFIRGVGVAVPIVMTVRSPSALATGVQCFAPSAHASIALLKSRRDREVLYCQGRTPGFWGNAAKCDHPNHDSWIIVFGSDVNQSCLSNQPFANISSLLFSSIFDGGFPGKKMHEVLWLDGEEDLYQLGAHLVAAYCNWKIGWVPSGEHGVLDLSDLQEMWRNRLIGYEPTAGVKWYGEQIVTYLKTTMPS